MVNPAIAEFQKFRISRMAPLPPDLEALTPLVKL
jgi:hypothetical protein